MAVAQLRGAKFVVYSREMVNVPRGLPTIFLPESPKSVALAQKALADVARHFGFSEVDEYLDALSRGGRVAAMHRKAIKVW
jgi:hypothetical protein